MVWPIFYHEIKLIMLPLLFLRFPDVKFPMPHNLREARLGLANLDIVVHKLTQLKVYACIRSKEFPRVLTALHIEAISCTRRFLLLLLHPLQRQGPRLSSLIPYSSVAPSYYNVWALSPFTVSVSSVLKGLGRTGLVGP